MGELETVVALFVGGPLHGTTREVPGDVVVWVDISRVVDDAPVIEEYSRRRVGGVVDIDPDSFRTHGVMLDAPNRPRYRRDVWLYGAIAGDFVVHRHDDPVGPAVRALVRDAVFRAWLRGGTPVEPSAEL